MKLASALLFFSTTVLVAASPAPNANANPFEPTRVLNKRFATNTLPASSGHSVLSTAMSVTGSFDGKMYKYDRGGMQFFPPLPWF
jgi:hypothetical protein